MPVDCRQSTGTPTKEGLILMHDPFYDLFPKRENAPIIAGKTALLTIDMQYLDAHRDGWVGRVAKAAGQEEILEPRWQAIDASLPNIRSVQDAFREAGQEVIHVKVAYRTEDGRDAGLAFMPTADLESAERNALDDDLLPEVAAQGDEMIFSKTSASVFSTTEIEQVLHRMHIDHLVITGLVTDGCVELSARDATDRGFKVTLVEDACTASTPEAHNDAIQRMTDGGFIAARSAKDVVAEVEDLST
jgi:nicotinamidase-related amidase